MTPTRTPTLSVSSSITPSLSVSSSITPSLSVSSSLTPTPTITPSISPSVSFSSSLTPTITPSITPSTSAPDCYVSTAYFNDFILDVELDSNDNIYVSGEFTQYSGVTVNHLVKLNPHGYIDTSFDIGSGTNFPVYHIKSQNDGKILINGTFTTYSGISVNDIIRLNTDGTIYDNIQSVSYTYRGPMSIQTDGKILVREQDYSSNNWLVRINTDGSVDESFVSGYFGTGNVEKKLIQPDGKILCIGAFESYSGITANYIVRLNSNGDYDDTFITGTGFDNVVLDFVLQSDGKIICVGPFTSYSGISCQNIARLNTDGSYDSTFTIGTGFGGFSYPVSISIQGDQKILVGGPNTSYNGTTIEDIVRINIFKLCICQWLNYANSLKHLVN
jgi:uncharacterized delta-60 repeat protein